MLDTQISLLNYIATMHLWSGEIPNALGNSHFGHVPYDAFATQDGYLIIAVISDDNWLDLVQLLALHDLATPDNAHQPGRAKNRDVIQERINAALLTNTREYWLTKLRAARIPCAPVNNVAQALNEPQVRARGMVVEIEYPEGDVVALPGNPVKMSETYEDVFTPPPTLGADTDRVMRQVLRKTDQEIARLRHAGII